MLKIKEFLNKNKYNENLLKNLKLMIHFENEFETIDDLLQPQNEQFLRDNEDKLLKITETELLLNKSPVK